MESEEISFEQFFAHRIKEKGVSLKRLSDITGIAPVHIENMLRGDFGNIPSAPYFHGYLVRIGKALDFDGEEWWATLKEEGVVKNSGETDALPKNRFLKKAPPKFLWPVVVVIVILILLAFQAPRILGKPSLTIMFPTQNPYMTSSSTLNITGSLRNADSLSLNGDNVIVATSGLWQKGVLLQDGLNTFQIIAKKFLGGENSVTEQVLYQPVATTSTSASTSTPPVNSPSSTETL
jgi:cytoskeletal protein RodZ